MLDAAHQGFADLENIRESELNNLPSKGREEIIFLDHRGRKHAGPHIVLTIWRHLLLSKVVSSADG
jgi:hypothetical protein